MIPIFKTPMTYVLASALLLGSPNVFSQEDPQTTQRLDNFIKQSCTTTKTQITSESVSTILKYDVYYITQEIKNIYGEKETEIQEFIVVDNGHEVQPFEKIQMNTPLPKLTSYIREDFILNPESSPLASTLGLHLSHCRMETGLTGVLFYKR